MGTRQKRQTSAPIDGMRKVVAGEPSTNYSGNHISTRRYTWWSFLPVSILFQFRKLSNCYFLASAVVMLIPEISPLSPMSAIAPLIFVVAVSEIREFLEELGAARRDRKANMQLVDKITNRVPTQDLRPGDLVMVRKDQPIPADMVVLLTSLKDGSAFVETGSLDGETNLKLRKAANMTSALSLPELFGFRLSCEPPHSDMYSFKGLMEPPESIATAFPAVAAAETLNINNILLRGCILRNTEWVAGVIVYSGHDTKMLMNARSGMTPSKVTGVDIQMNSNVISLFIIQMVMCLVASIIGTYVDDEDYWYLSALSPAKWISLFLTYFILLNTVIPASLWVSVEILKFVQAFFIEADPRLEKPMSCNSKNTHEELGRITHVFSDKTGTLTVNKMKFIGASVAGKLYILPSDEANSEAEMHTPVLPFPGVLTPSRNLVSILKEAVTTTIIGSCESYLMEALSICHTCERVFDVRTGVESNQSSSPDEAALVSMAAECGFIFEGRPDPGRMKISGKIYDLLYHVPFSSERRMMTVVVRHQDGIWAFTKGADSSILPKCSQGPIGETKFSVGNFSAYGFRTLCVAYKRFTEDEWSGITSQLDRAKIFESTGTSSTRSVLRPGSDSPGFSNSYPGEQILDQPAAVEENASLAALESSLIESNFTLIGATAVEDRLQDGVPETLRALKEAGIKVCMITGDKRETAINIARSCGLISTKKSVYTMLSHSHLFGGGQFVPLKCLDEIARMTNSKDRQQAPPPPPRSGAGAPPQAEEAAGNTGERSTPPLLEPLSGENVRLDNEFGKQVWSLATRDYDPLSVGSGAVAAASTGAPVMPKLTREVTRPDCPAILKGQFSMVIDGASLQSIFASEASTRQLVDVLTFEQCEAVVFCRVSPKQKGEIVRLVKEHLVGRNGKFFSQSTLAIGDGANDINMINVANVGVGIAGNEGSQAANCADYSISRFSDLYRLLFVHGRWNYRRTTLFINIFMYKNFLFTLCQFWFSIVSLYTGQTVFDDAYVLLFNSIFCFVPLFLMGVIDKDVDIDIVEARAGTALNASEPSVTHQGTFTPTYWREIVVPIIYCRSEKFSEISMLKWCFLGCIQSVILFWGVWGFWSYTNTALTPDGGQTSYLWTASILVYTIMISVVSAVNMFVAWEWTKIFLISILVFNFALYFGFVFLYNLLYFRENDYMGGVASEAFRTGQFWLIFTLIMLVCMAPMILGTRIWKLIKHGRVNFSLKNPPEKLTGRDIIEAVLAAQSAGHCEGN